MLLRFSMADGMKVCVAVDCYMHQLWNQNSEHVLDFI